VAQKRARSATVRTCPLRLRDLFSFVLRPRHTAPTAGAVEEGPASPRYFDPSCRSSTAAPGFFQPCSWPRSWWSPRRPRPASRAATRAVSPSTGGTQLLFTLLVPQFHIFFNSTRVIFKVPHLSGSSDPNAASGTSHLTIVCFESNLTHTAWIR